jgi:hypothetical protein
VQRLASSNKIVSWVREILSRRRGVPVEEVPAGVVQVRNEFARRRLGSLVANEISPGLVAPVSDGVRDLSPSPDDWVLDFVSGNAGEVL